MKLSKLIVLAALFALVAAPAMAVERQYQTTSDNIIVSPTAAGGLTFFPKGTWEGTDSRTVIEDNGFHLTTNPTQTLTMKSVFATSDLVNQFGCESTSGVVGCQVQILADTESNGIGAGNLTSSTPIPDGSIFTGGFTVLWPDAPVAVTGGRGQYCFAEWDGTGPPLTTANEATIAAYCATVLGLIQDAWKADSALITPISPNNAGIMHFRADMSEFATPDTYRYFELTGLENLVYGLFFNGSGVSPHKVPLGPLAALALGGSLAYMGFNSLRRKD